MKVMTNIPLGFLNGDNTVDGGNHGNQVTWSSTMGLLDGHALLDRRSKVEPDMVVFAVANAIQEFHCGTVKQLADSIEHFDCPKVMLSIGAQNDTYEMFTFSPELRSETTRLLGQMDAVNLRGEYTRDLLQHNGIEGDFKTLGCPSILLNEIPEIPEWRDEKVVLNMPRIQQCTGLFEDLVGMSGEQAVMLGQDDVYHNYSGTKKDVNSTSSIAVWREHLMGVTFSIGTRIHGSIMSLLCGVPTLCICIDSRTTELCRALSVPHTIYDGERFANFNELMNYAQRRYSFDRSALDDGVCRMQDFFDKEVGDEFTS